MPNPIEELKALELEHQVAVERRRAVDVEQRQAESDVIRASERLQEAIKADLQGQGDPKAVSGAQKALNAAQLAASQPWPQRRAACDELSRDAQHARERFIIDNIDALLDDERQRAEPVAAEMDRLASRIVELNAELGSCSQRVSGLVHLAFRGQEQRVAQPRSATLSRAAKDLLQAGGERPPVYEPPPKPTEVAPPAEVEQPREVDPVRRIRAAS